MVASSYPLRPAIPAAESDEVFDAMVDGGADIIEVEIPFSDPLADGATIQRAVFQALANGTTPTKCIDFVRRARARHPETPIVFMTYLNPVLAYGLERFATDAAAAGADAVILVDLPPEEARRGQPPLTKHGLDLIFLVAPTSSEERLHLICDRRQRLRLLRQRRRRHRRPRRPAAGTCRLP